MSDEQIDTGPTSIQTAAEPAGAKLKLSPREQAVELLLRYSDLPTYFVRGVLSEDGLQLPGRKLLVIDEQVSQLLAAALKTPAGPHVVAAWQAIDAAFPKPLEKKLPAAR